MWHEWLESIGCHHRGRKQRMLLLWAHRRAVTTVTKQTWSHANVQHTVKTHVDVRAAHHSKWCYEPSIDDSNKCWSLILQKDTAVDLKWSLHLRRQQINSCHCFAEQQWLGWRHQKTNHWLILLLSCPHILAARPLPCPSMCFHPFADLCPCHWGTTEKNMRLSESGCRWNHHTCTGVVGTNRSDIDWTSGSCGPVRRKLVHSLRAHHHTIAVSGCINVCSIEHATFLFVCMWQHMHV